MKLSVGMRIIVVRQYDAMITVLENSARSAQSDGDTAQAKALRADAQAYRDALTQVFRIARVTKRSTRKLYGILSNGRLIFFPAKCLEEL